MLNTSLYLCADNAEIKESPVTKNTYHPGKQVKNKFSEVRQWECGYRYGSSIRAQKKQKGTPFRRNDQISSLTVRVKRLLPAHTRRAHWHHYWVGPKTGERKLILHWIPSVYVSETDTQVAVIHNVLV